WVQGVALGATVVVGALIGESLGFWLGRWAGPYIRASWLGRRIGEEHWARSERYLLRRGGIAIFLSRFLPVLHSLVPLTVGMSGYAYRRFIAWTLPACVLWASFYVGLAAGAAGSYKELSERIHYAGYVFVGIIVLRSVQSWYCRPQSHRPSSAGSLVASPASTSGANAAPVDAGVRRPSSRSPVMRGPDGCGWSDEC